MMNHCALFCCSFTSLCCCIVLGFTHTTRERSYKNSTRLTRCRLRHSSGSAQRSLRKNVSSTLRSPLQVFYSMSSSKTSFEALVHRSAAHDCAGMNQRGHRQTPLRKPKTPSPGFQSPKVPDGNYELFLNVFEITHRNFYSTFI
uniref:Putative secreted protein n=1 Tax=Ixodes ricinus TaxID=34613 RepID=A0A6B0UTY3_IXORI